MIKWWRHTRHTETFPTKRWEKNLVPIVLHCFSKLIITFTWPKNMKIHSCDNVTLLPTAEPT